MGEPVGEMVALSSDGPAGRGYLIAPEVGTGPALVVLGGSRGLNAHIQAVCERLAGEGFVALAPDLDAEAEPGLDSRLDSPLDRAAQDLADAVATLSGHQAVRGDGVGVVGFGVGGALALMLATQQPAEVKACVAFDSSQTTSRDEPDWAALRAAVELHVAGEVRTGHDDGGHSTHTGDHDWAEEAEWRDLGTDVAVHRYDGVRPGFFDETRPEAYDAKAASLAWTRTLSFLRAHLG